MNSGSPQGGMWLDGMYFRYQQSTRESQADFGIRWNGEMLYMTSVTVQGDGLGEPHCNICGFILNTQDEGGEVGGLYAEGMLLKLLTTYAYLPQVLRRIGVQP